ncbi:MAG: hypothetical protein J3K34DRAFT_421600 [Monoraphidium minutum]|nr:MAG: hypothetical protein J3K34DRAFT_421600 [Monoraphidium minutum]
MSCSCSWLLSDCAADSSALTRSSFWCIWPSTSVCTMVCCSVASRSICTSLSSPMSSLMRSCRCAVLVMLCDRAVRMSSDVVDVARLPQRASSSCRCRSATCARASCSATPPCAWFCCSCWRSSACSPSSRARATCSRAFSDRSASSPAWAWATSAAAAVAPAAAALSSSCSGMGVAARCGGVPINE